MPIRWQTFFFFFLIWGIQKKHSAYFSPFMWSMWFFWEVYLFDCTGNHHPLRSGPEHKLPRVLPPQYDLLNQHPPVRRVTIFVQNLRRHSFNEQSFSNNKRWKSFSPRFNFEDLIFWGISNFQSQVGEWGRGSHYPWDEKKAPGEETVGEGRAVLWGEDKHHKNCKCCPRHSLFKGHNVIVDIVVLNCQKWNQGLKCQVSGHKWLGSLFEGVL